MKKKLSNIFDEANANEIEALVQNNAAPEVSGQTLQAVKDKVHAKTGLGSKKRKLLVLRWQTYVTAAVAACLVLMFGLTSLGPGSSSVAATFTLDVNPSIEISLDRQEKILAAKALNPDAEQLVDRLALQGKDLEEGLSLMVTALVENGYITELSNSVLVSIDGEDEQSIALRDKLALMIKELIDSGHVEGAVLSQTHPHKDSLSELAQEFGISMGKAAMIEKIVNLNNKYVFEELTHISINELNLILEKCADGEIEVNRQGAASKKAYITKEAAMEVVLQDLGVTLADISDVEIELEYYHDLLVYEVEFDYGASEFDYAVHAVDASILKVDIETGKAPVPEPTQMLTPGQALEAALADAKVSRNEVFDVSVEPEEDDGRYSYEVEFETKTAEYEYKVHAVNGSILERETKFKTNDSANQKPTQMLTPGQALEAALADAKVSRNEVFDVSVELEEDDGCYSYEVEFETQTAEYEYKIHAANGSVLEREIEAEENDDAAQVPSQTLTSDQALEAALADAKVSRKEVFDVSVELEEDDGLVYYEVEFETQTAEYEYKIHAANGSVLEKEIEAEDD